MEPNAADAPEPGSPSAAGSPAPSQPPSPAARAAARPPRQPTRTIISAVLLLVFMLVVWFQAPSVRLPTFFQRIVGICNALLAMLVVMFAIREYGKRYNRIPLPLVGKLSTSKVAGWATFLAVLAWWISPWAPIPAGPWQPDLPRLLESGLDMPMLVLLDDELATVARPVPPLAALRAADAIEPTADPFSLAAKAIVEGHFDRAGAIVAEAARRGAADATRIKQAQAQTDIYAGRYAAANRLYGELLGVQPRRFDFLAHGALAAMLAGDAAAAEARAKQLLDEVHAGGRQSPRLVQAVNMLAAAEVVAGKYTAARQTIEEMAPLRSRIIWTGAPPAASQSQLFADANNAAVIAAVAGTTERQASWAALVENLAAAPSSGADLLVSRADLLATAMHNVALVAIENGQYAVARRMLESLTIDAQDNVPEDPKVLPENWIALARLSRLEGNFDDARRQSQNVRGIFVKTLAADPQLLAAQAESGLLDASIGDEASAIGSLRRAIHESTKTLGAQHAYIAVNTARLAAVLLDAGQIADGRSAAEGALTIFATNKMTDSPATCGALRIVALAALRSGDHDLAQRELQKAFDNLNAAQPPGAQPAPSLERVRLLMARGELSIALQTWTAGQADFEEALGGIGALFGPRAAEHPLRAAALHGLATLYLRQGKPADAVPLLKESLAIDRQALPEKHPATAAVRADLEAAEAKLAAPHRAEK